MDWDVPGASHKFSRTSRDGAVLKAGRLAIYFIGPYQRGPHRCTSVCRVQFEPVVQHECMLILLDIDKLMSSVEMGLIEKLAA
jgi:hypothetical protein